jgi:hypothetical protein
MINHQCCKLKGFLKYTILWISQNLSIPFWSIGHLHLMMNVYDNLHEILASIGMNVLVGIGFLIGYLEEKNNKK